VFNVAVSALKRYAKLESTNPMEKELFSISVSTVSELSEMSPW